MSENITTVETPVGKPVKIKVKPTKAQKAPKVKLDRSMKSDVPARDRRLALLKVLRKHQAVKATAAKPISFLAVKLGYNPYDVYMMTYRTSPLVGQELLKTVQHEDNRELSVYLTAKGVKTDPK